MSANSQGYEPLMENEPIRKHNPRERLLEFYRRLRELPQADSAKSAFQQFCETLDRVEDEWSGIAKQIPTPPLSAPDGRMYCPAEDHILRRADGSLLAMTRGHRIEISANGAERIINKATQIVEFER